MKMISNDLRSSCRSLLLGAYQGGGSSRNDPIFHDILDSSELIGTVPIDDTYKFTLNLWEDNIPGYSGDYRYISCAGADSENVGYDQSMVYSQYSYLHVVRILWRGNTPIYAAPDAMYRLYCSYNGVYVYDDLDTHMPYRQCVYASTVNEYVKSSAGSLGEFTATPTFYGSGVRYMYPPTKIKIDNGTGSSSFSCNFKYTMKNYNAKWDECEWTSPTTGETMTIDDQTKPPKIVLSSAAEESGYISISSDMLIVPYSGENYGNVFSDMTAAELDAETDMLLKAICEKYGDESCYTHVKPQILLPETEEST